MKRGCADRNDDDIVSITFVDCKYRIPVGIMRKIPRFELLLQDKPDVEAIHFNELDMGATSSMLSRYIPRVDVDMNDPQLNLEDHAYNMCKLLITTKDVHNWPGRLANVGKVMIAFDICVIDECNTFDVSFVGEQHLCLLKRNVLNGCMGYNKRLVQVTGKEVGIFQLAYVDNASLYLFTSEVCIFNMRAFFTFTFKKVE